MELRAGMPAPDFTLPLATFGVVSLSNMRGKPVILYFYPKDDTPGCTAQACAFRDILPRFGDFDAAVIGISRDSVESHTHFSRKYGLNFHLASDESGQTCADYGVWVEKNMYGNTVMGIERTTFLIDRQGIIRHIWRKVSVNGHAEDVRAIVERLHHGLPLPQDKPPAPVAPAPSLAPPQNEKKQDERSVKKSRAKKDAAEKPKEMTVPAKDNPPSSKKPSSKTPVAEKPAKKSTAATTTVTSEPEAG